MTERMDEAAIQAQIEADRATGRGEWRSANTAPTPAPAPKPVARVRPKVPAIPGRCNTPHPDHHGLGCALDDGHTTGSPHHKTTVIHADQTVDIHTWDEYGAIK